MILEAKAHRHANARKTVVVVYLWGQAVWSDSYPLYDKDSWQEEAAISDAKRRFAADLRRAIESNKFVSS